MENRTTLDDCTKFLAVIIQGTAEMGRQNFELAEKLFLLAQLQGQLVMAREGRELRPLAFCQLSLLRLRQGRAEESQQQREQALPLLEKAAETDLPAFHEMMTNVLMSLGEYRRAIPFCERALASALGNRDAVGTAEVLLSAGLCYCKNGLWDHAVVLLRGAVKIFRGCPGDPRLPTALLTLGNALRKASPKEGERCYREVADLHMAKGEIESATVAWVNLGIVCSEQGRHEESLEHYQRVLRVREGSPRTPAARMGTVLNNIANCYRRMRRFAEALQAADRAIALLEPAGGPLLASAYGTRGLIFRDEGRDAEAVEWLERAWTVREGLASTNLETSAEDLESQMAALERLERREEAAVVAERLARVRETMRSIQSMQCDLSGVSGPADGAVLIELGIGSRLRSETDSREVRRLVARLSEAAAGAQAGYVASEVTIPENTTLILYGADGEALFGAVAPVLAGEAICRGAIVTIRQGSTHRQVVMAGVVN